MCLNEGTKTFYPSVSHRSSVSASSRSPSRESNPAQASNGGTSRPGRHGPTMHSGEAQAMKGAALCHGSCTAAATAVMDGEGAKGAGARDNLVC